MVCARAWPQKNQARAALARVHAQAVASADRPVYLPPAATQDAVLAFFRVVASSQICPLSAAKLLFFFITAKFSDPFNIL